MGSHSDDRPEPGDHALPSQAGPSELGNPNLDDVPTPADVSVPVANVWWSDRANAELHLQRLRPDEVLDAAVAPGRAGEQRSVQNEVHIDQASEAGSVRSLGHGQSRALEQRFTALEQMDRPGAEFYDLTAADSGSGSAELYLDPQKVRPFGEVVEPELVSPGSLLLGIIVRFIRPWALGTTWESSGRRAKLPLESCIRCWRGRGV